MGRVSPNNGRQTLITATTSGGAQTLHTATNDVSVGGSQRQDEVTIVATNSDSVERALTVMWGGADAADYMLFPCPPAETRLTVDRHLIGGGLSVKAFASTASVISVYLEVGNNS